MCEISLRRATADLIIILFSLPFEQRNDTNLRETKYDRIKRMETVSDVVGLTFRLMHFRVGRKKVARRRPEFFRGPTVDIFLGVIMGQNWLGLITYQIQSCRNRDVFSAIFYNKALRNSQACLCGTYLLSEFPGRSASVCRTCWLPVLKPRAE